jgi:type I restriction enzyme, S subunit
MDAQQFLAELQVIANAPAGVDRLRDLILQLAICGDLVRLESYVEDRQLLERILQQKREHHEKKKVIPMQPPVPPGSVNAPSHWTICRLGDIALTITGGGTPSKNHPEYWHGDIPWASVKDLKEFNYVEKTQEYITEEGLKNSSANLIPAGRVIVCTRMGLGKVAISRVAMAINQDLKALELPVEIDPDFFLLVYKALDIKGAGMTVAGIKQDDLLALPVAIPPLEEQSLIVAKFDDLMALCDQLERQQQDRRKLQKALRQSVLQFLASSQSPRDLQTNWLRLQYNFECLFSEPGSVEELRLCAMQLAVRGLLTLQRDGDEPAIDLLTRIGDEQRDLVRNGAVKRAKPLPEVDTANAPFILPAGWHWARFPELGHFGRGKSRHRPRNDPKLFNPGIYPLVQTGEVARSKGVIVEYHSKYSEIGLGQSKLWPKGTLCITIAANIADAAILGIDACFPDSVVGFVPASEIRDEVDYFLLFMKTARSQLLEFAPSTAQKNINLEILQSVLIPVPPVAEMKRILERMRQINALCDDLIRDRSKTLKLSQLWSIAAVASLTGIRIEQDEDTSVKVPKTQLIAPLRLGKAPSAKTEAPLARELVRHNGEMLANDLWQRFGGEIDAFYAQLKHEVAQGWIREPEPADVRVVEA